MHHSCTYLQLVQPQLFIQLQELVSWERLLLCILQKEESQREAEWHKVQPRNQHTKQLQDKFSGLNSKIHQLTEDLNSEQRQNASLATKINEVQTARHELSQSLQHEQASHAKSEEQQQYAQNSLSMRTEALASKERQLSQVMLCTAAADFCCRQCICS